MNLYELTVVMPDRATSVKKESVIKLVTKLVEVFEGKVVKTDDWGSKDLHFTMKKKGTSSKKTQTGTFLHFSLELDGSQVKKLNEKISIEEDFVRHLLVRS